VPLSSPSSTSRGFSTTDEEGLPVAVDTTPSTADATAVTGEYVIGRVKSYIREKAYGFVVPNGAKDTDTIFIHRSGIKSAKLLPGNAVNTNPHLRKNESVRFIVVTEQTAKGPLKAAKELEYADGKPIPIYRSNYVENVKKYTYGLMGEAMFNILENEKDVTARQTKIDETFAKSKMSIANAQARYDAMTALVKQSSQ
jgi:cold shock CspA family protein